MSYIKQFEHLTLQLEDIQSATNNFADEYRIGSGGFGKVYKGELVHSEGKTMVALKRLDRRYGQGDPEFWKEIMTLSLYKHKNIVSLLGYCNDCDESILVYEYLPKKSLERYLTSNELTWVRRLQICIGAAHGLAYLHSPDTTQQRVLHRDVKSSNILLDDEWNAKISDFGLSKFGPTNQKYTFLFSNPVGTEGYCDPLYVETGFLTKESDVYSFGVVLFEVLCGRLCIDYKDKRPRLIGLARKCYEEKRLDEIIYDNIKDEINPDSLKMFTEIAYQCLKRDREERPLMADIVRALENALQCQVNIKDQVAKTYLLLPESSDHEVFESDLAITMYNEYDPDCGGLLIVTIHGGNDLNAQNPFVLLRIGPDIRRTTTKKYTRNPVWKETFKFTLNKPANIVLHMTVCSDSTIFRATPENIMGDIDIHLADVIKEKHIDKIYPLPNGGIHAELQWEPSESPVKTKPKLMQFMSSFYNLTVGKGE